MSVRVSSAVWSGSRLTGTRLITLLAIADVAKDNGYAWPGMVYLAKKTRMGKRNMIRVIGDLVQSGELEMVARGGGAKANLYRVNVELLLENERSETTSDEADTRDIGAWGVTVSERNVPPVTPPPVTPVSPDTLENRQETHHSEPTEGESSSPEQHLPGMEPPPPARDPLDDLVDDVWNHYFAVFGERLHVKALTPARRRQLRKGITAVANDVSICKRAIDGLKSYREQHSDRSQDVSLSVIFETGPHSRSNLTDQIEWWAQQSTSVLPGGHSKVPIDLTGVPSVMRGTIHNRRSWVKEMYEDSDDEFVERRGQEALDWLREQCGHEPIVQDGKVTGWREVVE